MDCARCNCERGMESSAPCDGCRSDLERRDEAQPAYHLGLVHTVGSSLWQARPTQALEHVCKRFLRPALVVRP
jgi:hypothetical protein